MLYKSKEKKRNFSHIATHIENHNKEPCKGGEYVMIRQWLLGTAATIT